MRDGNRCASHVRLASTEPTPTVGCLGPLTVRTTTYKAGRWCAPKKSTSRNSVYAVVRDYGDDHKIVWLSVGNPAAQWGGAHVTIQYANGEGFSLAKCWRNDAPRREPRTLPASTARPISSAASA